MKQTVETALWICSALLLLRGFSVHFMYKFSPQMAVFSEACRCKCNLHVGKAARPTSSSEPHTQDKMDKTREAYFLPVRQSMLSADHRYSSLTRLGSEVDFDSDSCPTNSVLKTPSLLSKQPLHASCPAVFVIGARKAGTTSLYQYLSHHPDFEGIHLENGPQAGETFYFSARYYKESWKHYRSRFPKDEPKLTGDASVGNLVNCVVPQRVFESCGNRTKIVALFRNPIKRYVSNFLMRTRRATRKFGNNTALSTVIKVEMERYYSTILSVGVDIQNLPQRWSKLSCKFHPSENLIFEGLYHAHLQNWLCNYPYHNNILILNSEEFYTNTSTILKQVYQFLGLSSLTNEQRQLITSFVFNKGKEPLLPHHQLQPSDRKKLSTLYAPFNTALFQQLKWPTLAWS